jgi:hypothetical protein
MVDLTDALMKAQGDIAKQAEVRDFDLNVEQVLDSWSVSHAVREIIANALDEQTLTQTAPIEIVRVKAGRWTIRDYGSGLNHTHLTQNENPEKRRRESEVIGRFGVGLKDALAVLDRHNVKLGPRRHQPCSSIQGRLLGRTHAPRPSFASI